MTETPVVSAAHYVGYLCEQGVSRDRLTVPETVIMAWGDLSAAVARQTDAWRHRWIYDRDWPLFVVKDRSLGVIRQPTGAAPTALLLELLIACGAKAIFGLSIAGALDPSVPAGTLVVPLGALTDDGTSSRYAGGEAGQCCPSSAGLSDKLRLSVAAAGASTDSRIVWSTDAIFLERPAEIQRARERGAAVVDMETAALYSVARYLGARASSVLVVTDELTPVWRPGFHLPEVREAQQHAVTAVIHSARS
jgi:uridine phosphorylase